MMTSLSDHLHHHHGRTNTNITEEQKEEEQRRPLTSAADATAKQKDENCERPRHHPTSTTTNENISSSSSNGSYGDGGVCTMIDNSRNVYVPVRLRLRGTGHQHCGGGSGFVIAMCRPDVLIHCPWVLQDLTSDVCDCLSLLPPSVHPLIRRTRLWINLSYAYGPITPQPPPCFLTHTTTHHHEAWLHWARDRPDKTLGIEIYSAADYRRMRLHWNGCGLLLHEYSHLFHQLALLDGLDNKLVQKAYALAQMSGLYDCVRRRDWAGLDKDFDLAYAMIDCKEFFAEMTVAYWSQSQCYEELDRKDPHQILLCSPPFLEPNVLARVEEAKKKQNKCCEQECSAAAVSPTSMIAPSSLVSISMEPKEDSSMMTMNPFCRFFAQLFFRGGGFGIGRGRTQQQHCNKFYPFTRGQLQHYDRPTFEIMQQLWDEIEEWDDPWREERSSNDCFGCCCSPPSSSCWWLNNKNAAKAKNNMMRGTNDPYRYSDDTKSCADTVDL